MLKLGRSNVALQHNPIEGVIETVPAYCSLLVCFDPLKLEPATLEKYLERAMESTCEGNISQATVTVIPVCYGGDLGPDLEFVSAYCKLAPEEVIALHSAPNYLIYMLGFTPRLSILRRHGSAHCHATFGESEDQNPCWLRRHSRRTNWYLSCGQPWWLAHHRAHTR